VGTRSILAAAGLAAAISGASAAGLPFAVNSTQGVFLHVSDMHFDPFADRAIVPRLIAAPVEDWEAILRSSQDTAFWRSGEDTSFPLLASMLSAAQGPHYDYVLNTGDNLAHNFHGAFAAAGGAESDYTGFVAKTMRFVERLVQRSFPGVPVIAALGNNDATCGDYMLAPQSDMLPAVGQDLPAVAAHPPALRDYAIGGFYAIPHPTVAGREIVVLSSAFWSRKYLDRCNPDGGDPGSAELAWLEWTLYRAKLAGRTVTLVMHIPPGIDSYASSSPGNCPAGITSFWQEAYTRRFLALVGAYKAQLRGAFAGHTHMDDFRVIADASGEPALAMRISPAVSPRYGNNPAFTVLLYDRVDGSVADYATFALSNPAKVAPGVAADWTLEYVFSRAYGLDHYDAAGLAALAKRIRTDAPVRATYTRYYAASAAGTELNASNWTAFACAQTTLTPDTFAACACPPH
jgi:sphingomyelin phosphodiesterase acid-like 3